MKSSFLIFVMLALFSCRGVALEKININFVDAAPFAVLEVLANQAGLSLVAGESVRKNFNKKITVHLKNISYREALFNVLRANGLDYEVEGKTVTVSTPLPGNLPNFKQITKVIYLLNLEGKKTAALLKKLYPKVGCYAGITSNEIVVFGRPSSVRRVENFIDQIDSPIPQILIKSQVLEISSSSLANLGLKFGSSGGLLNYVIEQDSDVLKRGEDFAIGLSALQSRGDANVLATPKIVTLDGRPAEINIGKKVPYAVPAQTGSSTMYWRVDYLDAGVKLKITPIVLAAGYLMVEIEPEVSAVSEWRITAAGEFPVISTRNVKTKVRIRDGETIVIGGLLSKTNRKTVAKLPLLGDLPLLGWIFQTKRIQEEKTEIIFMITPKLL